MSTTTGIQKWRSVRTDRRSGRLSFIRDMLQEVVKKRVSLTAQGVFHPGGTQDTEERQAISNWLLANPIVVSTLMLLDGFAHLPS